jgi:hypothetical protein
VVAANDNREQGRDPLARVKLMENAEVLVTLGGRHVCQIVFISKRLEIPTNEQQVDLCGRPFFVLRDTVIDLG